MNLDINHLNVTFGSRSILSNLSLNTLEAGKVISLVGPNGAGKTTLMRAIAGLVPSTCDMKLGDLDLANLSIAARAKHIAYMPQNLPQDVALSVLETVIASLEASPAAIGLHRAEERAIAILDRIGAADLALKRVDRLSGGQRQMAGIAQAMVREPRVLLLDEPTSALDLRHQLEVFSLARDYAREQQAIVIMVLHDIQAAARISDEIVVLADGKVKAQGIPRHAITPERLAEVWQVRARVAACDQGYLQIMVDEVL